MMAGSRDPNMIQLDRFLYLGDEEKVFPESVRFPFNYEKVKSLLDDVGTTDAAKEILRVYREGNYLELETLIYSLAVCAHMAKPIAKGEVYDAIGKVCTSACSMFCFAHFHKEISKPFTGWGRAHRRFLNDWYNAKEAKDLAFEVTKVKSRHKWTHKDILCMGHVQGKNPGNAAVLKYFIKGIEIAEKEYGHLTEAQPALQHLKAVIELCHATEAETAARLIELHDLCLEHIPTKLVKSKEVSLCLIPRIPITNLLDFLPLFYKRSFLKTTGLHLKAIIERLSSEEVLNDKTIDPLQSYLALRKWQNVVSRSSSKLKINTNDLDNALKTLHEASFKHVVSKDKRYLIALDSNCFMHVLPSCAGRRMTPSTVSELIIMTLVKAELSNVTVVVYSETGLVSVDIDNTMSLSDIRECIDKVKNDLSLVNSVEVTSPILWALQKKKSFDAFLVLTLCLRSSLDDECAAALKEYKDTLSLPDTRYIVWSALKSEFSCDKPDILSICGFNIHLLKIIQDFTCGVF